MIEFQHNQDYQVNNNQGTDNGGKAETVRLSTNLSNKWNDRLSNYPVSQAQRMENDILEYSPFNFYHGINNKRLLKGKSMLSKPYLQQVLSCGFCQNIIIQGRECPDCEQNFCHPCVKAWEASESAKYFKTPCKCNVDGLKYLNKLKCEYMN